MKYLLALAFTFLALSIKAQDTNQKQDSMIIYELCDEMPQFSKEDKDAYFKYVSANLKYPSELAKHKIRGTVYIDVLILSDGTIKATNVRKDIGGGAAEAATEMINNMPKWIPARHRGEPVAFKMVIPIKFM